MNIFWVFLLMKNIFLAVKNSKKIFTSSLRVILSDFEPVFWAKSLVFLRIDTRKLSESEER